MQTSLEESHPITNESLTQSCILRVACESADLVVLQVFDNVFKGLSFLGQRPCPAA